MWLRKRLLSRAGLAACALSLLPLVAADASVQDNKAESCSPKSTSGAVPTDMLFEFGTTSISPSGELLLLQFIEASRDDKAIASVILTGHTDQLGDPWQNNAFSFSRAEAVREFLRTHGFADKPIKVQGAGSSQPEVPLSACPIGPYQIACLGPNRRIDITVCRTVR